MNVALADLFPGVAVDRAVRVTGVTVDSRAVKPGDLFIAMPGINTDGRRFIADAVARGASAVVAQSPVAAGDQALVPLIQRNDLVGEASAIAGRAWGDPSADLQTVGVTGTNGKTTVVWLVAQALSRCGRLCGYAGTLGVGFPGGELTDTGHTTADAATVQALIAGLRSDGATAVALEVSSHALDQHRVDGVQFGVAVFTNLTRDHIDYHGTMDAYGQAKSRLFELDSVRARVVNVDDQFGRDLATRFPQGLITTGLESPDAMIRGRYSVTGGRTTITVKTPTGVGVIETSLVGDFNVNNLLQALGVLSALDVPVENACSALSASSAAPGRMETVSGDSGPTVVVDYAHTPDALARALRALRSAMGDQGGRLICVFGCGGDRDSGKRAQMGEVADQLADLSVLTDVNPRSESGTAIIDDILAGFTSVASVPVSQPPHVLVERDRAAAIELAVKLASPHDALLIAGKGHETGQTVGANVVPFSDQKTARRLLRNRGWSA